MARDVMVILWLTLSVVLAGGTIVPRAGTAGPPCLLNEVCYDPPGADGGREFVELVVPGAHPVCLAGWRLQFANGAEPGIWRTRWTGTTADTVPGGGIWLIADRGWTGPVPDAVVDLDLQNGPDAVRLLAPDGERDLLGYGTELDPALSEGAPHPGAPGGSLARFPDGHDTDRNDRDWRIADPPTPGAVNWPVHGLRVVAVRSVPAALAWPATPVRTTARLHNRGREPLPAGTVRLLWCGRPVATAVAGPLPAGAETTLAWAWQPARRGRGDLACRWPVPPDTVTVRLGGFHCGEAALRLAEIEPRPAPGVGEWVELVAMAPVELSTYRLADADGDTCRLPSRFLAAGERVVLTADPDGFAAWWWDLPAAARCGTATPDRFAMAPAAGWPVLNNTVPAGRDYADQLVLVAADGTARDAVVYGRDGDWPAGHALERSLSALAAGRDTWLPAAGPGGASPGCPNLADADVPPVGRLGAPVSRVGPTGATLLLAVPAGTVAWRLEIYDRRGRLRRHLAGDGLGPGPRRLFWDGTDDDGHRLPPGPCIALWRWRKGDGTTGSDRCLLVVLP